MTTATTPQAEVNETQAKENLLKRFAKAFYAKMAKAAEAVSHFVQRITHANDLVAPVEDEEALKPDFLSRASRFVLGALKFIGSLAASLVKIVVGVIIFLVGIVISLVMMVALLVIGLVLVVSKLVQGLALFMASPYNYVRDKENSRLQWKLYFSSWTPKVYVAMKDAFIQLRQAAEEAAEREATTEPVTEATFVPVALDEVADPLAGAIDRHPAQGTGDLPAPPMNRKSRRKRHLYVVPNPAVG